MRPRLVQSLNGTRFSGPTRTTHPADVQVPCRRHPNPQRAWFDEEVQVIPAIDELADAAPNPVDRRPVPADLDALGADGERAFIQVGKTPTRSGPWTVSTQPSACVPAIRFAERGTRPQIG